MVNEEKIKRLMLSTNVEDVKLAIHLIWKEHKSGIKLLNFVKKNKPINMRDHIYVRFSRCGVLTITPSWSWRVIVNPGYGKEQPNYINFYDK